MKQIWEYREFIRALVQREFRTRYTQSVLGLLWLILEPALLVGTFSVVFTLIGRKAPGGHPFPLYFYSAVLVWRLFAAALKSGTDAFVSDRSLIQKMAFPRQISIIRSQSISFCDYLFESAIFIVLLVYYGVTPTLNWLFLPLLLMLTLALSYSLSLLLGSLNVYFRDVGILVGTLVGIGFWFTPVLFDFPPEGQTAPLYDLNPMAGIVRNFRYTILGSGQIEWHLLQSSLIWITAAAFVGAWTYGKLQRRFADVI